ncbi:hypothetical protein FOZ61_010114, partial [Perkinsus olseni]
MFAVKPVLCRTASSVLLCDTHVLHGLSFFLFRQYRSDREDIPIAEETVELHEGQSSITPPGVPSGREVVNTVSLKLNQCA